jgi:monoamine oxidase
LHSANAFDGKPQRIRDIKADFDGGVAELLAKATKKGALDDAVSKEDQEILLEALRSLGALDKDFRYRAGEDSAAHRAMRSIREAVSAPSRSTATRSACMIF